MQWAVTASKIWKEQLIKNFINIRSSLYEFKSKELKLLDFESSIINAITPLYYPCTQNNIIVSLVAFEMSNYNVNNFKIFLCF